MSGSLKSLATYRPDAFAMLPAVPFTPENIRLGTYTFMPWVRSGISAGIADAAPGTVRAQVTVTLPVNDETGASTPVSQTITVRGPGDVLGLDASQIVRRYPMPGTTNAEDSFLAHVEFDRPELPWLFSPFAPAADRIAPWIALVVLEERLADFETGPPGLPPRVRTRLGQLQPLDESWAWAHAQVIGPLGAGVTDRLTSAYAQVNLSRLLCPRRLDSNIAYVACIVPSFDVGVRTGMGLAGGKLAPAWARAQGDEDQEIVLPVYDRWRFATGDAGSFESLAEKLVGIAAPWSVGRRVVDASRPRGGVTDLAANEPGRVQVIRCALAAPATAPRPDDAPAETDAWSAAKTGELRDVLNAPDALALGGPIDGDIDLPLVGPRIYARHQRGESRVDPADDANWFGQVNLAPMHRIAAGLGTRVVQMDQEPLMQAAWAQMGDLEDTNRAIRRAQFARFAGASLHARHFSPLSVGDLAQVTRGIHGKLRLGGAALTVFGAAARSATAPAALAGAFRRATRTRGPLARFLDAPRAAALKNIVAVGGAMRDLRRQYTEPDGIVSLSAAAIDGIRPEAAAKVLGLAPTQAVAELRVRSARFAALPSAADQLLSPARTWRPSGRALDVGSVIVDRALDVLRAALPAGYAKSPARAESIAALLTGIGNSRATGAARATRLVRDIDRRIPATATRTAIHAEPAAAALAAPAALPSSLRRFDSVASRTFALAIASSHAIAIDTVVAQLSAFAEASAVSALPLTPERTPLALARDVLLDTIRPARTVTSLVRARLTMPSWLPGDWFDDLLVRPIMAAPSFTRPMYEALDAYDREWLVPGLGKIPQTDFVTLLETNPTFIEAFFVGLSDEMGRELLWRGYPTDQRGTYFKRFWDASRDELGADIHRFTKTPLGTHQAAWAGGAEGRLVLVVRGELIRRYPDAILLAMRTAARDPLTNHPIFHDPVADPGSIAKIIFLAPLAPDVSLVGFDLTVSRVLAEPWWFLIAEHPTAPRFGLDEGDGAAAGNSVARDALDWDDLGALRFGRFLSTQTRALPLTITETAGPPTQWPPAHAGIVAHALLQSPIRAAFDAKKLIAPAIGGG